MSRRIVALLVISLAACLPLGSATTAQSDEEAQAQVAEQAGKLREAVTHYAAAFRALPWSEVQGKNRLRGKILEIVLKLDPAPAIPEEAERRMARGKAALKAAQSPSDYEAAANELLEAMNQAPWWADAYFNLGMVREKQHEYERAISNLKNYLAATPKASDAKEVTAKIYELEYLMEKEAKARAEVEQRGRREEEQRRATEQLAARLEGVWHPPPAAVFEYGGRKAQYRGRTITQLVGLRVRIRAEGSKVYITCIGIPAVSMDSDGHITDSSYEPRSLPYIEAEVVEASAGSGRLTGTENQIAFNSKETTIIGKEAYNARITLSYDGRSFTASHTTYESVWIKE